MRFEAESNVGQQVFYLQGAPVVLADGGKVRVMMGPADSAPEKNQRVNFYLRVQNLSEMPITVSEDQIRAIRSDEHEIRIWRAIDVRKDIARRADGARFAAALAAALGNVGAAYGSRSPGQEVLAAQQRAQSQLEMQEQIKRANDREALESSMLGLFMERETILPGAYYFGFVQIDPPDRKGKETTFKFLTIFADDPIPLEFRYFPAD